MSSVLHPGAPEGVAGIGRRRLRIRRVREVPRGGAREQGRRKGRRRTFRRRSRPEARGPGTLARPSPRSRSSRFLSSQRSSASTRKSSAPAVQAPAAAVPLSTSPSRKTPSSRGTRGWRRRASMPAASNPVSPSGMLFLRGAVPAVREETLSAPRRADCALGHPGAAADRPSGRQRLTPLPGQPYQPYRVEARPLDEGREEIARLDEKGEIAASAPHVPPLGPVTLLRPPLAERAEQRADAVGGGRAPLRGRRATILR